MSLVIDKYATSGCTDSHTQDINFFSSSEADLCTKILKAIHANTNIIHVCLPTYAQDSQLAKRIGNYIHLRNTHSVVIDAQNYTIEEIVSEFAYQLGLGEQGNIYKAFGQLITEYFHHNKTLNAVIYNAHTLSKQDFDYLFELASLIYEKFPTQRHKALMRFVFISDDSISAILRKKTNGQVKKLLPSKLTITEAINVLYLMTVPEKRDALFYQTVSGYAQSLLQATAGYPALLRKIMPLPSITFISEHPDPTAYLSYLVNDTITEHHLLNIQQERTQLNKVDIPYQNIFVTVLSVVVIMSLMLLVL